MVVVVRRVCALRAAGSCLPVLMVLCTVAWSEAPLPVDRFEAAAMMGVAETDSVAYGWYRPLYDEPLQVRAGELGRLPDFFAAVPDAVLPDSTQLAAFEPWGEEQIRAFFTQYPHLVPYRPILAFGPPMRSIGSVVLRGSISPGTGAHGGGTHAGGTLRLAPGPALRLRVGALVSDSSVVVLRREVRGVVGKQVRYQVGDLTPRFHDGLVLGASRAARTGESLWWSPLIWGSGRGLSGLAIVSRAGVHSAEMLVHTGPHAAAFSLWNQVRLPGGLSAGAGVTSADTVRIDSLGGIPAPVLQGGGGVERGAARLMVRVAGMPGAGGAVSGTLQHCARGAHFDLRGTWYSGGFDPVLGREARDIERFAAVKGIGASNRALVSASMRVPLHAAVVVEPFCRTMIAPGVTRAYAGVALSHHAAVATRYRYAYQSRDAAHHLHVSLYHDRGKPFAVEGRGRCFLRDGVTRLYAWVRPLWRATPWVEIAPTLAMVTGSGGDTQWRWGGEKRFTPFETTSGSVRFTVAGARGAWKEVDASVSFRFLF